MTLKKLLRPKGEYCNKTSQGESILYSLFPYRIRKPVKRDPIPELPAKKPSSKKGNNKKKIELAKANKKDSKSPSSTLSSKTPSKAMTPAIKKKKISELEKKVSLFNFYI